MWGLAQQASLDAGSVSRQVKSSSHVPETQRPPLFAGMPPEAYSAISAAARNKVFARGETIHHKGDSVEQVLLLTTGLVKVTQLGRSGSEVILRLGVPGIVLGATCLLVSGRHFTTAHSFRSSSARVWDAQAFKLMTERFPILQQNMVRILGEDLLELEIRFREVATEKVSSRLAHQLVRLRETIGRPVNDAVEISLSREELAQMTGTTLFTVSRLLSAWEACGIVKPSREAVMICNIQLLRALSEEA